MNEAKLQLLLDRAEISDIVTRYAMGMDLQDWKLFRSCLSDQVEADYSEATGQPAATLKANDFVAFIQSILSTEKLRTQTLSTNNAITIEGDRATCVSYYVAQHYLPKDSGSGEAFKTVISYQLSLIRRMVGDLDPPPTPSTLLVGDARPLVFN
ncbi:hypothetical protein NIES4073_82850 [Kalymmatonema gypsitolerans NIES-4073]|nr:hypothetical protein NIES4073_82850 [Scytonema sp. NIES-4073]